MPAMRSEAEATTGHRPAAPSRADFTFGFAPFPNKTLISGARSLAAAKRPDGGSVPISDHDLDVRHATKKSGPRHHARAANYALLNAFFAISANSPSMSMVNFSGCVCSAPTSRAPGVTRGLTAQPMRVAVRTEAGAHARL
jgi:hypothetical protein